MIDIYIKEFLEIVKFLLQKDETLIRKGFLCISKKALLKLLEHNQYETAYNKLVIWRGLQWIDADAERFTRRMTVDGRQMTAVKIRLAVYETLEQLMTPN